METVLLLHGVGVGRSSLCVLGKKGAAATGHCARCLGLVLQLRDSSGGCWLQMHLFCFWEAMLAHLILAYVFVGGTPAKSFLPCHALPSHQQGLLRIFCKISLFSLRQY